MWIANCVKSLKESYTLTAVDFAFQSYIAPLCVRCTSNERYFKRGRGAIHYFIKVLQFSYYVFK